MAVAKVILNGNTLIDTTQKTVTAGSMLDGVTALKNDGTDITGSITSNTSSDLTASGDTVTAPAGYYASSASKAVASGSATTPATTITANPTISVSSGGLITATVSASQSVTPTVSAGYVSSGTAGTVSVSGSNTSQLITKPAQTYTPTTTDQTIASGKYLTGTQTIKGDANLLAINIKKGVVIFGITGTYEGDIPSVAYNVTVSLTNPAHSSRFRSCTIYEALSDDPYDYGSTLGTISTATGNTTVQVQSTVYGIIVKLSGTSVYVDTGDISVTGGVTFSQYDDDSSVVFAVTADGTATLSGIDYNS